jgi:hypothetical protein
MFILAKKISLLNKIQLLFGMFLFIVHYNKKKNNGIVYLHTDKTVYNYQRLF